MKILLLVKREDSVYWVQNAVDEFTVDDVGVPDEFGRESSTDGENTRTLWVEIPDGSLSKLWDVPTATGAVVDDQ